MSYIYTLFNHIINHINQYNYLFFHHNKYSNDDIVILSVVLNMKPTPHQAILDRLILKLSTH